MQKHNRSPSEGTVHPPAQTDDPSPALPSFVFPANPLPSPPIQSDGRALGELLQSQQNSLSPKKSSDSRRPPLSSNAMRSLHKKTLSSISLKSLAGKDAPKEKEKEEKPKKPKKAKSTTNFATLLSRPRSTKNLAKAAEDASRSSRDKENRRPSGEQSPIEFYERPPPIYAQFSSQHFTTQPLGGKFLEDEVDLYAPGQFTPRKQRNMQEYFDPQPSFSKKDIRQEKSKSIVSESSSAMQEIGSRIGATRHSVDIPRNNMRPGYLRSPHSTVEVRPSFERRHAYSFNRSEDVPKAIERQDTSMTSRGEDVISKRGSRVMAAVAAFSLKAARTEPIGPEKTATETELSPKDIDAELEAMLDRRNIPENHRHKMRSLALSMKKDLIRQDYAETAAARQVSLEKPTSRPGTGSGDDSCDGASDSNSNGTTKRPRPLSKTFTLSKSTKEPPSPTKKQKPEGSPSKHARNKSADSTYSSGSKSLTSTGAAAAMSFMAKAKGQHPDDFVAYLRKVRKPEAVEVGKLHKLRLLLRNETVSWTETFITLGGMAEIVGLLHRTMEVEWR
jgi:hypothetical protein